MRIEFIAKNYEITDKLREIVEKKVERLERYFDNDTKAKVLCKKEREDLYTMELTIRFGANKILRSEVTGDNMYDNIDVILPKIDRQLHTYKTKLEKSLRKDAFANAFYQQEAKEELPSLVRKKTYELKKISVEDAMTELELVGHAFYAFLNEKTGMVNVVYKRNDGDIGLIDLVY